MLSRISSDKRLLVLASIIFWLLITVISATQLYVRLADQYDGGWLNFFWRQGVVWIGWAILTPFIFLTIRYINSRFQKAKLLLTHLGCALVYTFTYSIILGLLSPLFFELGSSPWEYTVQSIMTGVVADLLVYMLIAVFSLMLLYYKRSLQDREKSHQLDLELQSMEKQLISAQLEALKSQIQPHFLFNSLHSVASLIRKQQLGKATDTIAILSDLLRATLRNEERNLISLKEELGLVSKYLQIEKVRFGNNLEVTFQVDPATSELLVPAFILQPLVENCFKHAFKNRGSGILMINSSLSKNNLQLSITDNGEGLTEKNLQTNDRIGIKNVRKRLENLYQQSASFSLLPHEWGGTTARVTIPVTQA